MVDALLSNQVPRLASIDLYGGDLALKAAVRIFGAQWAQAELHRRGRQLYCPAWLDIADAANRNPPQLRQYDPHGLRVDDVVVDPAWHALLQDMTSARLHNAAWAIPRAGAQVARGAGFYLQAQLEAGSLCPVTMTFAATPLLLRESALAGWHSPLLSKRYDPRPLPGPAKHGVLIGMGMTEKQGGSDLRSNQTRAEADGDVARIYGHKWFFSVPQADAHLVLAQSNAGPSCYFMPRRYDDGGLNAISLLRLKDKLGNWSNASAEVEFDGALAYPVGEPGRGIATLLEMAARTRLDCAIASAGLMRMGLLEAMHYARHRRAFGVRLVEAPLMQVVLAELAVESEAAMWFAMRLAHAADGADEAESLLYRVLTPVAKFWICKRAEAYLGEVMEVLGGNGYCEDFRLARAYREAPVNAIWEGAGNVMCLDVLRTLRRLPGAADALLGELGTAAGLDRDYDRLLLALPDQLRSTDEAGARRLTGLLARLMQASLLLRYGGKVMSDAYCGSRLSDWRNDAVIGESPFVGHAAAVLKRAWPE
ncbi:acyl-CoA dehydrogenase [Jeongeupia sp. HS-3]|uniref:isovaleryl-CoA dehydrogenase n=1 Tax=Jeongeupia sp. HS-3 TaxID=1009682 RepID=UPI0018A541C6|nr:isovaleryl-CoA dehydrogenase [Jeongeupia sp. HS-3]BCL75215.1 acyl-CoA dehydrogenase [Jeongeupia sp. HS-3]